MHCSLQDIFAQCFDAFALRHKLHPRELQAAYCIRNCFTPALASHALVCPQGHYLQPQLHGCHHRSCPRCAARPRALWTQFQLQRLLPCPHVHIVFTWPHVLLPLWSFNRTAMISLLFACARDTLLELSADLKRLGVCPALLMALHTWGRDLSHHPHIHCLLSAGGIDLMGNWRAGNAKFLLPLKPVQCLFRGKLLASLKALLLSRQLTLPAQQPLHYWLACIKQLYTAHWNVQIQPPYAHARGLALYLARYVKGGPLPADRPLSLDSQGLVRLPYTDHRDGRTKTLCLPADEFIARILWHTPPKGIHTVRYAGLYTRSHRVQYAQAQRQLSPPALPPEPAPLAAHPLPDHLAPAPCPPPCPPRPLCPICNSPLQLRLLPPSAHRKSQISLNSQRCRSNTLSRAPPTIATRSPAGSPTGSSTPRASTSPPGPTLRSRRHRSASPSGAS